MEVAAPRGTRPPPSIWWWAFGYFAAYVPYSALTKVVTSGLVDTGGAKITGVQVLPISVIATVGVAVLFLFVTGWWRHAVKPGERLPRPTALTALSGLCASGIIATTTLAYTFGATIVFVMLLMRGGVLILAPLIDLLNGRKIRWYSTIALGLSIASLVTSVIGAADPYIPDACKIDIAAYLFFYFVRLQIMSRKAKSADPDANLRYFVEEQLVSAPALLLALIVVAAIGAGGVGADLRTGFAIPLDLPLAVTLLVVLIGVTSQGTGIFGGLILLDRRENTFSIPVNRASSVLAGVVASVFIWQAFDGKQPESSDLYGAAVMIAAILVLSLGGIADRWKGPRPVQARRIAIAAVAVSLAAAGVAVFVTARGRAGAGKKADPVVLVLSSGHARGDSAERLEAELGRRSGLAIEVRVARSEEDAVAMIGNAGVDGGLLPVLDYLLARQELGVTARLQALRGEGSKVYGGVLLVRSGDAAESLDDLAGQRVAYVSGDSTTGYLLAARRLAEAKVTVRPVFAGSHDAALEMLRRGEVAAAATHAGQPLDGLRVLAGTGTVPNEPLFFHADLPAATADKIADALVALAATPEGAAILADTAGITGFTPVTDADYQPVHDLLAATQKQLADVVPGGHTLMETTRASPGDLVP